MLDTTDRNVRRDSTDAKWVSNVETAAPDTRETKAESVSYDKVVSATATKQRPQLYISHWRGTIPGGRVHNGAPTVFGITWRRRQISQFLSRHCPGPSEVLADSVVKYLVKRMFGPLSGVETGAVPEYHPVVARHVGECHSAVERRTEQSLPSLG